MPDLTNVKEIYVTYKGLEFKVDEKLNIELVGGKVSNTSSGGSTSGGGSAAGSGVTTQVVGDISVNVTITNIKAKRFTINLDPGEDESKIAMYQYYINGELVHEGIEKSYEVTGLNMNTNYNVSINVIPKNTINVANLQQKTDERSIILLSNLFDKYIYIDSTNGSDEAGDGTSTKPYATLDKIAGSGIIENGYSYGIILKNGTYNLTTAVFGLTTCNKSINIIGNRQNTILKVGNGLYANGSGGSTAYTVNLYRLIWDGDNCTSPNTIFVKTHMNLYGVVFKNIADNPHSYFISAGSYEFYNCTLPTKVGGLLRTDCGTIHLTNCYGGFTSGGGGTPYQSNEKPWPADGNNWNYQTNYMTNNPQVNSTTYQITENESVWKNVGTGMNADETQANLGVYGGEYSWEFVDDIFD